MTQPLGRLDSVQIMRGAAALLVVGAHSMDLVAEAGPGITQSTLAGLGHLENFGAIGVDLFFIISGFVMALSVRRMAGARDARNFLALRWVRIAPPYLLVCLAFALYAKSIGNGWPSWQSIFNSVFFVPVLDESSYSYSALVIGWTLSFEFTFYLAVAGMVAWRRATNMALLAGLMTAFGLVGAAIDAEPFIVDWVLNPIALEFVLGIVAYLLWKSGRLARARCATVCAGALGAAALGVQLWVGSGGVTEAENIVSSTDSLLRVAVWGLPMFGIFLACLPLAGGGAGASTQAGVAARRLGDASYSLYLVHLLAILLLKKVLERSPVDLPGDVVFLLALVGSAVAGVLYYRFVERPITEWMRRGAARVLGTRPQLAAALPTPKRQRDPA